LKKSKKFLLLKSIVYSLKNNIPMVLGILTV